MKIEYKKESYYTVVYHFNDISVSKAADNITKNLTGLTDNLLQRPVLSELRCDNPESAIDLAILLLKNWSENNSEPYCTRDLSEKTIFTDCGKITIEKRENETVNVKMSRGMSTIGFFLKTKEGQKYIELQEPIIHDRHVFSVWVKKMTDNLFIYKNE